MARFRRFRRTYRGARSYGRRGFRRARGAFGNNMVKWGIGAVAGAVAPQFHPMQDVLITALAVAPVRLPYGIKTLAQGYVGGKLLKPLVSGFGVAGQAPSLGDASFV